MLEISDKRKCCGCAACKQICPKQCISMTQDDEGFFYPSVDKSKCIDCKLCEKTCPILNPYTKISPIKVLAFKHERDEIRMTSSSGGAFSAIAEYILQKGGVVFGAKFNDDWQVCLSFVDKVEDLSVLKGSKYVQAQVGNAYVDCKRFLKKGRLVFFTGTPCQIAGLKHYLNRKYENLLTGEIICHGVPSPLVWDSFLKSFTHDLHKIKYVNFRSKNVDGSYNYVIRGKYDYYNDLASKSIYSKGFILNYFLRPSCYFCKSKECRSHADITMGDCWGIEDYNMDFYDKKGVSVVCFYSDKVLNFLSFIIKNSNPIPYEILTKHNSAYCKSVLTPINRTFFWKKFKLLGVNSIILTIKRDQYFIFRVLRKLRRII